MRIKPTIIMFVLALLSVMAAAVLDRADGGGAGEANAGRNVMTPASFAVDDVDRIELTRDGRTLVFERDPTGWWQTEPFRYPMDPFSIRQFAVLVDDLDVLDVIDLSAEGNTTSRSALALDPPAGVLTLAWGDESVTLHLGRRGVAGRAYLQRADADGIAVVNADLHARALDMNEREWRDRTVFREIDADVERIVRVQGGETMTLERTGRLWQMTTPAVTRVDSQAMEIYLSDLTRMRAAGFVLDQPDDLSLFGLEQPVASLDVQTSRAVMTDDGTAVVPETQRLIIGATAGAGTQDRFAMMEGRPAVIRLPAAAIIQSIVRPVEHLIDATGSGASPADVKSVIIRTANHELTFTRQLDEWKYDRQGTIVNVPPAYVEQLLQRLTSLRAPRIVRRAYPREAEVAVITMRGFDRRPLDTVRLVRDPSTGGWAMENGDNVLRILDADVEWRLTPADYGL